MTRLLVLHLRGICFIDSWSMSSFSNGFADVRARCFPNGLDLVLLLVDRKLKFGTTRYSWCAQGVIIT